MVFIFPKFGKILLITLGLFCIIFSMGCSKGRDSFAPATAPPLKLTAEVEILNGKMTITNNDNFVWEDPLVTISSGSTSKFYRGSIEDFAAGEKKVYSIEKFKNANDDEYDITNPIANVVIRAKNTKGQEIGSTYYF